METIEIIIEQTVQPINLEVYQENTPPILLELFEGQPGDSAYVEAVKNGFVGTEQEWLNSLKGEKGDNGEKGDVGEQGIQGVKGDKGDQGIQGPIGLTGAQGAAGTNGTNGVDGIDGVQGLQGIAGTNGINGTNGVDGAQGPIGLTGPQGLKGDTGEKGEKGDKGDTGATGSLGYSPPRTFFSGSDGITVANTTTITVTYFQLIPAGTFTAGNVVELLFRSTSPGAKTSASSNYVYLNTANNLSGTPLQLAISTGGATTRTIQLERALSIKGATTKVISSVGTIATDTSNTGALTTLTIDWTINQYIIFAIGHTVADQTLTGDCFRITKN